MMLAKFYEIILYGVGNQIYNISTHVEKWSDNMYVLVWKDKYGNIDAVRTFRDKNRKEIFQNINRLDRGKDKYLTIFKCADYNIIYTSGAGWIK